MLLRYWISNLFKNLSLLHCYFNPAPRLLKIQYDKFTILLRIKKEFSGEEFSFSIAHAIPLTNVDGTLIPTS